ncbi:MAG: transcriptional repressor [Candidatus Gastranaerophilales bacterium]|nr:transcriptional repressor [Candidatus Gastranaerophilales bacterium]
MFKKGNLLELKSCRTSKNRKAVLDILEKSKNPLTVDCIYNRLREKKETVSISTVYRIMEKLTSNNITSKSIIMDDKKARYELIRDDHKHYIICIKCNQMTPLENCPLGELEKSISMATGFNITGHKLELYGECSSCNK